MAKRPQITPITVTKDVFANDGIITGTEKGTLAKDEGIRAKTTAESVANLQPIATPSLRLIASSLSAQRISPTLPSRCRA